MPGESTVDHLRYGSRGQGMNILKGLCWGIAMTALGSVVGGSPAVAATYVYVSNAEDGDISVYTLQPDGALTAAPRVPAAKIVMPMAVSPDRRFLYAGVRSKPYSVHVYAINPATGALTPVAVSPLAETFPVGKGANWVEIVSFD